MLCHWPWHAISRLSLPPRVKHLQMSMVSSFLKLWVKESRRKISTYKLDHPRGSVKWVCIEYLKLCFLQSAKTNLNVEQVFFSIARDIKQRLANTDSKAEVYSISLIIVLKKITVRFWLRFDLNPMFMSSQPTTIKINEHARGSSLATQKPACCGS